MAKTLIALAIVCGAYLASAQRQRTPKVEVILRENLSLGEGPHWDHKAQALYWVDIFESTVFKYDPSTWKITRVIIGGSKMMIIDRKMPKLYDIK